MGYCMTLTRTSNDPSELVHVRHRYYVGSTGGEESQERRSEHKIQGQSPQVHMQSIRRDRSLRCHGGPEQRACCPVPMVSRPRGGVTSVVAERLIGTARPGLETTSPLSRCIELVLAARCLRSQASPSPSYNHLVFFSCAQRRNVCLSADRRSLQIRI